MDFVRLRLSGFKSFVEPTNLVIESGLTGIVGPNGCGKSNLVEGLRWVMGETSARQMRGREMDDVIFGGSAGRPPRNVAEITLYLENVPQVAVDAEDGAVELSRRIARGKGSAYSINGRDVRARDVHLLFADQATGARGTTLVSQGGIGEVIGAKPIQRRALLEEAAGITGLHSRRHEAELKLSAAEANLDRLNDVFAALDAQHQGYLRQVRQAVRYRNLGERIRRDTALLPRSLADCHRSRRPCRDGPVRSGGGGRGKDSAGRGSLRAARQGGGIVAGDAGGGIGGGGGGSPS